MYELTIENIVLGTVVMVNVLKCTALVFFIRNVNTNTYYRNCSFPQGLGK